MNEYDYGGYDGSQKEKTFVSEEQKTFWEAFSQGAINESERTFFTGNPQAIIPFLGMERERENSYDNDRRI